MAQPSRLSLHLSGRISAPAGIPAQLLTSESHKNSRRPKSLSTSSSHLIPPHGGELVDLIAQPETVNQLKSHSREWPSWDLTARQLCDLELLLSGGFSPLRGFMNRADYEGVCSNMKLASGVLWPMPITLGRERRVCQER